MRKADGGGVGIGIWGNDLVSGEELFGGAPVIEDFEHYFLSSWWRARGEGCFEFGGKTLIEVPDGVGQVS